jgi:hypothetical protein
MFRPCGAGVIGTTPKTGKIEKNLLFGTIRNRQVLSETTMSTGFTALESACRQRRVEESRGAFSDGRVKARLRWEDYGRVSEPRRPDSPQVRRSSHFATPPDRDGTAKANSDWDFGQAA